MMRAAGLVILVLSGACRRHAEAPPAGATAPAAAEPAPAAPLEPSAAPTPAPSPSVAEPPGPRMPDGGTINGDPRGPRAAAFNAVVAAAQPRLVDCFARVELPAGEWNVTVHYIVEPPGYTGAVAPHGNAPRPVQDCARQVVEGLRFPEFHGPKVEQDLPITIQRTDKAVKTEVWDAGQPR